MGDQLHRYKNLLNRQFQANKPNSKWVTDISYIHTGEGILYLSMIRDLYDNSIIAYKTGTEQTVNLVLDTIHLAMKKEKKKSLKSCSSTAIKALNIPHTHISSLLKLMALRPRCQDEETAMIMQWQKISFQF